MEKILWKHICSMGGSDCRVWQSDRLIGGSDSKSPGARTPLVETLHRSLQILYTNLRRIFEDMFHILEDSAQFSSGNLKEHSRIPEGFLADTCIIGNRNLHFCKRFSYVGVNGSGEEPL